MGSREQICARLFAIGSGIHAWNFTQRNVDGIPPNSLPLFGLWDGDQAIVESATRPNLRALAPFLVEMTPTMAIAVAGTLDSIGPEANQLHDDLMYAVLSDTALYALIANKYVRYRETITAPVRGTEELAITLNLVFEIRYELQPNLLAPATA